MFGHFTTLCMKGLIINWNQVKKKNNRHDPRSKHNQRKSERNEQHASIASVNGVGGPGGTQRWSVKKLLLKLKRIHRKIALLKSLFNKVKGLQICIQKRLQPRCFLLILRNFYKHLFWITSVNYLQVESLALYKPVISFANIFPNFAKTTSFFMFLKFWSSYFEG